MSNQILGGTDRERMLYILGKRLATSVYPVWIEGLPLPLQLAFESLQNDNLVKCRVTYTNNVKRTEGFFD